MITVSKLEKTHILGCVPSPTIHGKLSQCSPNYLVFASEDIPLIRYYHFLQWVLKNE